MSSIVHIHKKETGPKKTNGHASHAFAPAASDDRFSAPESVKALKSALDAAFVQISQDFQANDISIVMPTYSPPQGRLLAEFNKAGGVACIAGGKIGADPAFKNVPQYGLPFNTTAYTNVFPEGMSEKIAGAIPDDALRDRKVALFSDISPSESWEKHLRARETGASFEATCEQNTRAFFENKGNLMHILEESGLGAYVIPTEVVSDEMSKKDLCAVYDRVKSEDGKVVIQPCVENYHPTRFAHNEDELLTYVRGTQIPFKVVRFVEGNEANLSFFCGNTVPSEEGRGVMKCALPEGVSCLRPENLAVIEAHAAERGLSDDNTFAVVGRATLKVVGDRRLAVELGDGVGNNIGHVYPTDIAEQITEVGTKLGKKMAKAGKVGLAGADLIIDRSGKIWINEINDRQQGPTDQMSADAEASGIPGLSRMAWFAHYGDFKKEENRNLMTTLKDHADEIHQGYMTSPGSFYIKILATHAPEHDNQCPTLRDLHEGVYAVSKQDDGRWQWDYKGENAPLRPVDLASGDITVKVGSGSIHAGEHMTSGTELFRVVGMASGQDAPFIIDNKGESRLNPRWYPIIERLYEDCYGPDYMKKSPLYVPPREEMAAKSGTVPVEKPLAAGENYTAIRQSFGI